MSKNSFALSGPCFLSRANAQRVILAMGLFSSPLSNPSITNYPLPSDI